MVKDSYNRPYLQNWPPLESVSLPPTVVMPGLIGHLSCGPKGYKKGISLGPRCLRSSSHERKPQCKITNKLDSSKKTKYNYGLTFTSFKV